MEEKLELTRVFPEKEDKEVALAAEEEEADLVEVVEEDLNSVTQWIEQRNLVP